MNSLSGCGCRWLVCLCLLEACAQAQTWQETLAQMPLLPATTDLRRTNCVEVMLRSFRSNALVKAVIFMPGATDEFYMFRRAQAHMKQPSPSLLDAVEALTQQTLIRATFQPPMLLLHTDEDPLAPDITVVDLAAGERLRHRILPHLFFNDRDWAAVQPSLKWPLKMDVRPWRDSKASWHFYRHSFAGWNLTAWEALQATALAGKSKFTVLGNRIVFEPDPRVRAIPHVDATR